jgi:hypothetical protein
MQLLPAVAIVIFWIFLAYYLFRFLILGIRYFERELNEPERKNKQ